MRMMIIGVGLLAGLLGCSRGEKPSASQTSSLVVINVLDRELYDDAHIKGSIHVPFAEIEEYAATLDKKTPIVVYCSSYACSASGAAQVMLKNMGFENVWAYEGGMAEWYQLQLPTEGPAKETYLRDPNPRLESTHAQGSITAQELKQKMGLS